MTRIHAAIVSGIFLMISGCQTSEKQRRADRLTPAASPAVDAREATGPTIYGEPAVKSEVVPCNEGDAGRDLRSAPNVDVGVKADVVGKKVQNPRVYSEANCVP